MGISSPIWNPEMRFSDFHLSRHPRGVPSFRMGEIVPSGKSVSFRQACVALAGAGRRLVSGPSAVVLRGVERPGRS